MAPEGLSRLDLAEALAENCDGTVRRFFHPQSEPSEVPGQPVFHNLTLGFQVFEASGAWAFSCVDDLTLQADLERSAAPKPGWYRIVSDDERLLSLIQEQARADQELERVLDPIASLFGTQPTPGPGGMFRVNDRAGASIAIVAPLPGERERPCELVTAPLSQASREDLGELLQLAGKLKFSIPAEGATHLHFDATRIQNASAFSNLVQLWCAWGENFKQLVGTNPNCQRLGAWPEELLQLARDPDFRRLGWLEVKAAVKNLKLTKYCDFNLLNCVEGRPDKNTVEIRVLPVWLEPEPLFQAGLLFAAILELASGGQELAPDLVAGGELSVLLEALPLEPDSRGYWG